jgi:hypothetical protein
MNPDTYDQIEVSRDDAPPQIAYMCGGERVAVVTCVELNNEISEIRLPEKVEVEVIETGMSGVGDSNDGGMKKAVVVGDNGVEHELSAVPQSVKVGDRLVVDVATESFHSKAKKAK